jgi:energy-coupling factor transporter ATP-binding protein EcfA2
MFENIKSDIGLIKHAIENNKFDDIILTVRDCIINKFTSDAKGLLSQQVLTPEQISKLAIELLGIPDPEQELKKPEMSLYHELEIFASNDKTSDAPDTYFNQICRCVSISGREYFKSILMAYTDNLEILHRRQSNLEYFRDLDPGMHRYLSAALTQFSMHESVIFWNIGDKSPEMQQVLDMLFFTKSWTKFLNYKPGFMGVYYYLLMIISPIWGIISPFVFFFVPYLFARYIIKIPIPFEYYTKQMQDMLFGKQFFAMIGVAQKVFTAFYMGPDNTATLKTKLIDKLFVLLQTGIARWLYLFVILASYLYGIYNYIVSSMNYNKLLNFIHDRIKHIRILVDSAVICLGLLESQTHNCNELAQISSACYKLLNENEYILYLRSENVCMSEPGFFKNKGPIIKAYYMLEQIDRKEVLAPFIKLYAWIDTWMHTATHLSPENKSLPLCIVNWDVSNTEPMLNITDCWSPVGGNITNSITLTKQNLATVQTDAGLTITPHPVEPNPEPVKEISEDTIKTEAVEDKTEPVKESTEDTIKPEPVEAKPEAVCVVNRNCLLTGPNGSGKSTFLKAVMSAVVMAQTFGICPATACRMTPFKYLSTYLNIPDCQGRESLFQAEMRRCHEHLNKLRVLEQHNQFSFNIMDEIFVSTNYLEGISGAYGVIKSLEQYPGSINIITTHFDKLTSMALPQFCYKYFTINTHEDTQSGETQMVKDYKLRDGINDKHMALQLLKLRGFDETLIQNANALYSSLVDKKE